MKESKRPKKYLCDVENCGKAYSRPCLLNQHRRSHFNERPFVCDQCDKRFYRESHLASHKWTHSGTKPLSCHVCHKGFVTGQQLSRHLKTHTADFICPYECPENFYTEQALSSHMLEDHVISDTVDIQSHLSKISNDITIGSPVLTIQDWNLDDWGDYRCKEVQCLGGKGFGTLLELLNHYDEGHKFVPESLVHQNFMLGPFQELGEPVEREHHSH